VIFADSLKGVCPVICLQYLQFLKDKFIADTIQISVIEAQLRLFGNTKVGNVRFSGCKSNPEVDRGY
jgi:hypothetical protein